MDEARLRRLLDLPVLAAALLVIPLILVEQSSLGNGWKSAAALANWLIWLVFAVELVAYLVVVRGRRLRWLRDHPLELAIVVLTPPFLPASLQALRVFRLLRVLRLLRLAKLARSLFSTEGLRYAGVLALVTALGGGAAFSAAEKNHSAWDGVWWAVTTMTTVGYGDVPVTTTGGRLIGIVVMLLGIGFVALLTGAVAERFLARDVQEVEDEVAGLEAAEADVARELREIADRLLALEARIARQAS